MCVYVCIYIYIYISLKLILFLTLYFWHQKMYISCVCKSMNYYKVSIFT